MTEPLRLFLIEDDDDIALLIRRTLERSEHHVTRCRSASDALIVLAQTGFDLVLLDQKLPDMTGLELLQRLSRDGVVAPVLMVTARGDEHLATRVLQAGAMDYIVKDPALTFLGELPKRVTESVRRHRLEQNNRLLISSLESARDGIMITDLQGIMLKVNHALEVMTGYTRSELLGQTPRILKSGAHPSEFYARMWQTILNRTPWQGELINRRKDGRLITTSMTISPVVDQQGRLTHFVGIQRDMTEHKRLEQQLIQAQKMQSVGTLAGGIAHEFNNLLAGINGYASLGLREPNVDPTLRLFLQNIVTLSERAAGMTRQLLAFARKPALTRQRTVLAELLRSTVELVKFTLHQEVRLELPADTAALLVSADSNQLQQALVNLALNARDALRQGEATAAGTGNAGSTLTQKTGDAGQRGIVFRLQHELLSRERSAFPQHVPPGDYLVVTVEDSGCGMTSEVLQQVLDPFFTTKDVGQGTGLGLPMVFGIIQGHQGYLTIDSEPGRGTRVGIYLPRLLDPTPGMEVGSQPQSASVREQNVVEPEQQPGCSIVVIDDEEAVLDVVRRFLEIAGHQVHSFQSGQQAIEQIRAGLQVDLVILDLMMPREDARATFQRLRQLRPDAPVLLCTGLAEQEQNGPAPALLRQPSVELIRKPFRMHQLWYWVTKALRSESRHEG